MDIGLRFREEDSVDILRSHEDFAVPFPLNWKTELAWVVDGRGLSVKAACRQSGSCWALISGVDIAVHLSLSNLLEEDSGLPIELRLRNRVVGAEVECGRMEGVAGDIAIAGGPCEVAKRGASRLFEGGRTSVECGLHPNARPIAATPTVPVAHS